MKISKLKWNKKVIYNVDELEDIIKELVSIASGYEFNKDNRYKRL